VSASPAVSPEVEQGWRLLAAGRAGEALALAERAVARTAAALPALHLQAEAALRCGRAGVAQQAAEAIVRHNSGLHWAWILLARATLAGGFPGRAAQAASHAVALADATAATFGNAGAVYAAAGQHEAALQCFTRATALAPEDARHLFNLAMQRRFMGDLTGAEADCDRLIAQDPDHFEAWLIRSGLRRQTAEDNHVADLKARLVRGAGDWRGEGQLLYALAKELEDIGEDGPAFAALAKGARLRRGHLDYDIARDLAMIDALVAGFGEGDGQAAAGEAGAGAIFIVGLPRTGTTVAERILSSHSQVQSLGEPSAFPAVMMAGMRRLGRPASSAQERVAAALAITPEELGQGYLDRLEGLRGSTSHFIDKLPMNFLNVGLIRRALPQARIIHLRRDPMDAGYAMFKTWFADAYPYSYDQKELGLYIAAYHRLMAHWKAIHPGAILDIDYEDLVSDVEGHARTLLAHCGLGWEAACAAPHRNAAPSTTASASQIRQPVHARSVGAWTRYRQELEPLRATLQAAGLA
jgi:tetratricopeptide (TPR) repeat protein